MEARLTTTPPPQSASLKANNGKRGLYSFQPLNGEVKRQRVNNLWTAFSDESISVLRAALLR